jgi:hypothetical protein
MNKENLEVLVETYEEEIANLKAEVEQFKKEKEEASNKTAVAASTPVNDGKIPDYIRSSFGGSF